MWSLSWTGWRSSVTLTQPSFRSCAEGIKRGPARLWERAFPKQIINRKFFVWGPEWSSLPDHKNSVFLNKQLWAEMTGKLRKCGPQGLILEPPWQMAVLWGQECPPVVDRGVWTGSPSIRSAPGGLTGNICLRATQWLWVQWIHVLVRGVAVWLSQVCTTCNCPVNLAKLPCPPVSASKGPPTLRRSMLKVS